MIKRDRTLASPLGVENLNVGHFAGLGGNDAVRGLEGCDG